MSSPSSVCEIKEDPVQDRVNYPKNENSLELCNILRHTITDLNHTIKNMETDIIFLRKENFRLENEYLKSFEMITNLNITNRAAATQQQDRTHERGFGNYGVNDW
jgi:hypothetical protein